VSFWSPPKTRGHSEVAGDEHAAPAVPRTEHVEQLAADAIERHEANLVDDDQVDVLQLDASASVPRRSAKHRGLGPYAVAVRPSLASSVLETPKANYSDRRLELKAWVATNKEHDTQVIFIRRRRGMRIELFLRQESARPLIPMGEERNMKRLQATAFLFLISGCGQNVSVGTSSSGLCVDATYAGDCGQVQVIKTDGTECPAPSAANSNTCNHNNNPTIVIDSCSTVMNFRPDWAGHVNSSSSPNCGQPGFPACTVDTGWFETVVACCTGGSFGAGVNWGEAKICCQVTDGQSPARCDTPCGLAGKQGCAPCFEQSAGVGGSCSINTGRVEDNDCPRGMQFFESVSVQDINGCPGQ
jgi:hypothetical protein